MKRLFLFLTCSSCFGAQIVNPTVSGIGGSGGGPTNGLTMAQTISAINTNNAGGLTVAGLSSVSNSILQGTAALASGLTNDALNQAYNVIYVDHFGAFGNAKRVLFSGTMTNHTQVVTASSAQTWAVGQSIVIHNVNGWGTNLTTIITNVTSTTLCTVSNACTFGATNVTFDYGNDDTAAFQAAINYWNGLTNNSGAPPIIGLHDKNYLIAGPYVVNPNTTNTTYVQLQLPYRSYNAGIGGPPHMTFTLMGDEAPPSTLYPGTTEPNNVICPVIIDSVTPPANNITNSTMIGYSGATAGSFGMNCINMRLYNIEVWGSYPMSQTPFNERFLFGMQGDFISINPGQPAAYATNAPLFANRGIVMPTQANGGENSLDHFLIRGCGVGLEVGDHAMFGPCNISLCNIGVGFGGIAANYGGTYWDVFVTPNIFANPTNIACLPNSAGGMLKIIGGDIEHDTSSVPGFGNLAWVQTIWDIDDPNNLIFGEVNYLIHNDAVSNRMKVNGGGYISFDNIFDPPFKTKTNNFTYFLGNTMNFSGSANQYLVLDCTTAASSGGFSGMDLYSGEMANPIELRGFYNRFELVQPNVGVFGDWGANGLTNQTAAYVQTITSGALPSAVSGKVIYVNIGNTNFWVTPAGTTHLP